MGTSSSSYYRDREEDRIVDTVKEKFLNLFKSAQAALFHNDTKIADNFEELEFRGVDSFELTREDGRVIVEINKIDGKEW